jgi:pilus assembly protein CpaE
MNIYLYEADPQIIDNVTKNLEGSFAIKKVLSEEKKLTESLSKEKIDVLIIDINEINVDFREAIKEAIPYIISLSRNSSPAAFKKALEFGVKDYIPIPFTTGELLSALNKARHYLANVQAMQKVSTKKSAKIITLISSKGGTGKSVLAANLAVMLQKELCQKVLILDTVRRFGSIDIILDLNEKKSMEMVSDELEPTEAAWQEVSENLIKHKLGLELLTAGDKKTEHLPPAKIKAILTLAKDKYDYIIIDTENYFEEPLLSLLEMSDMVLYVSLFDLAALKNLKLGLETIKAYYFSTEKIKLIINCFDHNSELTISELEKFLSFKVSAVVPEDRPTVIKSINKGIPFTSETSENEIYRAMQNMVALITGKECVMKIPEGNKGAASQNWLKSISGMFTEK